MRNANCNSAFLGMMSIIKNKILEKLYLSTALGLCTSECIIDNYLTWISSKIKKAINCSKVLEGIKALKKD